MLRFFFLLIYYIPKKSGCKLSKISFIFWALLERNVVDNSPLAANTAPVIAPLPIEFHGSSLPRIPIRQQSNVENKPPHTAKLPEMINCSVAIQN